LIDIRNEVAGIRGLTKDATVESFGADWAMKRAVQHALLIISEATRHIPDDLKNARPRSAMERHPRTRQHAAPRKIALPT
jgi:uncharacterized protein with HEPN domain